MAAYDAQVECFRAAAELADAPIEPVEIPYEGTTLPGYLYRVDDSGVPRPTVLMCNGFDGSAEEMYFGGAAAAVERGYNVLVFDGPGQPGARHRRGLFFRPDWEHVVYSSSISPASFPTSIRRVSPCWATAWAVC